MELKLFTRQESLARSGKPMITISKNGLISFSRRTADMIGFTRGDIVVIGQDPARPKDWYLAKSKDKNAFTIRGKTSEEGGVLCFNATGICNTIRTSIGLKEAITVSFQIGIEPVDINGVKYWPIITRSASVAGEGNIFNKL